VLAEWQALLDEVLGERPRHLHGNRRGLLAVCRTIDEQLSTPGPLEEHRFEETCGEGLDAAIRQV
jgi:hypothetical protein